MLINEDAGWQPELYADGLVVHGFFSGLAIMITGLGCNLLGDWLRDLFDPTRANL